jgi:hypothetical protein
MEDNAYTYERNAVLVRQLKSIVADLFPLRIGNAQRLVTATIRGPLLLNLNASEKRIEGEVANGKNQLRRVHHEQSAEVGK